MKVTARLIGVIAFLVVVALSALALRLRQADNRRPNSATARHEMTEALPAPATAPLAHGTARTLQKEEATASEPVSLVGNLVSNAQATLSAAQPARILAVDVREGDRVRRGQLLVQMDDLQGQTQERTALAGIAAAQAQLAKARTGRAAQQTKADADVATAQAGLEQAQSRLQQAILARDAARVGLTAEQTAAQENVRKAQAALDHALQTLHGLEQLNEVGGVSRSDLEGARTQVATAQSDLNAAQAQAQSLKAGPNGGTTYRIALAQKDVDAAQQGVKQAQQGLATAVRARRQTLALAESDIRSASAAVDQAQAGLIGAQALIRSARLASPIDGVATGIQAHVGETAQPGAPLLTVTSLSGLHVEALALARQLPSLRPGQSAQITLDTRPGHLLNAVVDSISRIAEPDGRSFRVKLRLLNPPSNLRAGQIAHISISKP